MTRQRPDYSAVAGLYAVSRPRYPSELFDWLASLVRGHDTAWDSATGSGQAALGLAAHFDRVIATDLSEAQILHATAHPKVEYRIAAAEASGLPPASVDLVVAAAALHWFDLPSYYAEVRRVARPGGVVAAWTYHVAHAQPPFDAVLWPFYRDVVSPYFAAGARLVDDRYRGVELPGTALDAPIFVVTAHWTASDILSFVRTWSGVQSYQRVTGNDPVAELEGPLETLCRTPGSLHELRWPLYVRASRL